MFFLTHLFHVHAGLRKVALGCAILGVLMMSLQVHVHVVDENHGHEHQHGHQHDAHLVLGSIFADVPGVPDGTTPDGTDGDCLHCHCVSPSATEAEVPTVVLPAPVLPITWASHVAVAPDGWYPPPDPPPVRLS